MLLIKNGRVVDPASKTEAALDVLLDGEKIKEVGPAGKIAMPSDAEIFDAGGGARRVHGCLLHAEYEAGERQCFRHAVHSGSSEGCRECSRVADWRGVGGEQRRSDCRNRGYEGSGDRR